MGYSLKLSIRIEVVSLHQINSIFFFEECGIYRELTTPYTPEQNRVAERKNHTVVEMTRNLLKGKGLINQY